jgi:hypothetical protein
MFRRSSEPSTSFLISRSFVMAALSYQQLRDPGFRIMIAQAHQMLCIEDMASALSLPLDTALVS